MDLSRYLPIPEKLKLYLEGKIQESCSTKPSYIARVKWGSVEIVVNKLKEKCDDLKTVWEVMFKCVKGEGTLTFTKNGRLIIEASSWEGALRLLEEILA